MLALKLSCSSIILCLSLLAITVFILLVIVVFMTSSPYPDLGRFESEKYYEDPDKSEKLKFPSIHDLPSMDLSVIVPAYNEEERLPKMMDEALEQLEGRQKSNPSFRYEVIIVDDGSKDKTTQTGLKYSKNYGTDKVRVLTLAKNRGIGGAVRLGMFVARGKRLLFADADGASKFSDLDKLDAEMTRIVKTPDNLAVVCGSRAQLDEESIAQVKYYKTEVFFSKTTLKNLDPSYKMDLDF